MRMHGRWRAAAVALVAGSAVAGGTADAGAATVTPVASFDHEVTGVTVSASSRTFVSFPRWTDDAPVSVAEVQSDGSTTPYPNARWNSWRNARPQLSRDDRFVCVQSVVAHGTDLWVVDAAAPAMGIVLPSARPKLVRIDLRTNRVERRYLLPRSTAPGNSYLNDLRVSPDGRWAYVTDSNSGAIVVVDVRSGASRRVLGGDRTTAAEPGVAPRADGAVLRRPDGRTLMGAADGIALSLDGRTLYWQSLAGVTLRAASTRDLRDARLSRRQLSRRVRTVGVNGVADGLLITQDGAMVVTSPEDNALRSRVGTRRGGVLDGDGLPIIAQDPRLRWPDTLAQAPDLSLRVTSSRLQDTAFFKPLAPPSLTTTLLRVTG